MKTTGFLKTVALSAVLLVSSVAVSARNYDNNLTKVSHPLKH